MIPAQFNFEFRRRTWPKVRDAIAEMAGLHTGIKILHDYKSFRTTGVGITFLNHGRQTLKASVGFIHYGDDMQLDALKILSAYLRATKQEPAWDRFTFSSDPNNFITASDLVMMNAQSDHSYMSRYAKIGLYQSWKQIGELPPHKKLDEVFHSIVANTACIELRDPNAKPLTNDDMDRIVKEVIAEHHSGNRTPSEP